MVGISRNGTTAFIGVPAREAAKLEELWIRDELGMELSVDVRAPVVVGIFPMRIARYAAEPNGAGNGASTGTGDAGEPAEPAEPMAGEATPAASAATEDVPIPSPG